MVLQSYMSLAWFCMRVDSGTFVGYSRLLIQA